MSFPHWISEDYFHAVISKDESISVSAVDKLVDDIQTNKRSTTTNLLSSGYGDQIISSLIISLQSASQRIAGNSAFILGSLAEDRHACLRIIANASTYIANGWMNFADTLVNMLNSSDNETILNASGTLGTITECEEGRDWILDNIGEFNKLLVYLDTLLQSTNRWIASNSALVLARFSISDRGLHMILESPQSTSILEHLISSLGVDEAGCGLNCAFTLGRVCDTTVGINRILKLPNKHDMLSAVKRMLATVPVKGPDWGVCKNACFCFSCLVATAEGNDWIVRTPRLLNGNDYFFTCEGDDQKEQEGDPSVRQTNNGECILSSITRLLDMTNLETSWFAAMAVRSLASHPRGLIAVRRYQPLVTALKDCLSSPRATRELYDEARAVVNLLGPLQKAPKPKVLIYGQNSALVRWSPMEAPGQMTVTYLLYFQSEDSAEPKLMYRGTNLETRVTDLQPYTKYAITLRGLTDVEEGPASEPTILLTEEAIPPAPINLHAATITTTQVRLAWNPPKRINGVLRYYMVRVDCLDQPSTTLASAATLVTNRKQQNLNFRYSEKTTQTNIIISGLTPQTLYSFSVCIANGRGVGPSAVLSVRTHGLGSHCPTKPTVLVLGRSEVMLHWEPPKVPLGRISRYEVYVNNSKSPAFSGTAHSCRLSGLQPDTDYCFTVVLVTNQGKFESNSTKKRTARSEYACPPRPPLHEPIKKQSRSVEQEPMVKRNSIKDLKMTPSESIKTSAPVVNNQKTKHYSWLTSMSMPNLLAPSTEKEPNPHGDRANPVRTNSSPTIHLDKPITAQLSNDGVTKPALKPCTGPRSRRRRHHHAHHDQLMEHSLKRDLSLPVSTASGLGLRDQSSASMRSQSGDRSFTSEHTVRKRLPSPKQSKSGELKSKKELSCTVDDPESPSLVKGHSVERMNNTNEQNPPMKRTSGFWRFAIEKNLHKKQQQQKQQLRSEHQLDLAHSPNSNKPHPQNISSSIKSDQKNSVNLETAHDLYLFGKKQTTNPFRRHFGRSVTHLRQNRFK